MKIWPFRFSHARIFYRFFADKKWEIFVPLGQPTEEDINPGLWTLNQKLESVENLTIMSAQYNQGNAYRWLDGNPPTEAEIQDLWQKVLIEDSRKCNTNQVREEAKRRIVELTGGHPDYFREKQLGMLINYNQILHEAVEAGGFHKLSTEKKAKKDKLKKFHDQVEKVLEHCNKLEDKAKADEDFDHTHGWPEA